MKILVQRCVHDLRGGVALMFALAMIPVIGSIGIAIDLALVTQARTQLNSAADAAALAAAKGAADAFTIGRKDYIAVGQAAGGQWFYSQANFISGAELQSPMVTVTQSGAVFTSTVNYLSTITPYFAPIFGVNTVPLAGSSSAAITTTAYLSVTFLLDNSSSMLFAATQTAVDKMNAITPSYSASMSVPNGLAGRACSFACHWDAGGNDYYGAARSNKLTLRLDVLQTAVVSAINMMIKKMMIIDQFSLGIYTFGNTLTQVYPAGINQTTSTDLINGIRAATGIQTPVVTDQSKANTDFPAAMHALAQKSTAAGDGSSAAKRRKALIIITDGMADYGTRSTPTSKGPINPASCTAMKNLGYNIYILYITYIITPADVMLPFDNINLLPYINGTASPTMAASLQSCASTPANYAEASDPSAINTAMTQMLQAVLSDGGRFIN